MPDLIARVVRYARDYHLFDPPGVALLAVSGGADSMALLDLFARDRGVAAQLDLRLAVGHVDHGIQPESDAVAGRVRDAAEGYGIPYYVRTLGLGSGTSETVARESRYAALRAMQADADAAFLVTAHHADDQIETVLYRALRGSAPAGLAGIPIKGRGGLIRPLLCARHDELTAWARQRFETLNDDPANRDARHDRSWLRTDLLPRLRARFPDVDEHILRMGRGAASDRRAWAQVLGAIEELEFDSDGETATLALGPFQSMPSALAIALLRAAARDVGAQLGPSRAARLYDFARAARSGRSFELAPGWVARASFDKLTIAPIDSEEEPAPVQVGANGGTVRFGSWEFTATDAAAGRPRRTGLETWIEGGAEIRSFAAGDRVRPLGGLGRRKVRRLLMEARVPVSDRRGYPVLVQGKHVVWIPGICRSAHAVPRVGEPALRVEARVVDE